LKIAYVLRIEGGRDLINQSITRYNSLGQYLSISSQRIPEQKETNRNEIRSETKSESQEEYVSHTFPSPNDEHTSLFRNKRREKEK